VDTLILEGLRVGESFHKAQSLVPSDQVAFQMAPAPPEGGRLTVTATEWKVLCLLDGIRNVREIAEASKLSRPAVIEVIVRMAEAGFLERVEVQKPLRAQSGGRFAKDTATVDERLGKEWSRITRLAHGVLRVEIRSLAGRRVTLPVAYRAGLIRDIHLPRAVLSELHVREGEDVKVRPVA
jgi:DNA-binding Lrp family transcriptional regulator